MKTLEQWKTITEYQGHAFTGKYEVSNWGNVRNRETQQPVAFYSDNRGQGYQKFKLVDTEGNRTALKVHRLVAYLFLDPPKEDQKEVNHKDGNPRNNSWTNLEWSTHQDNMAHYFDMRQQIDEETNALQPCKYCGTPTRGYVCRPCYKSFEMGNEYAEEATR